MKSIKFFLELLCGDSLLTFQTFTDSKKLKEKYKGNGSNDPYARVYHATLSNLDSLLGKLKDLNSSKPVGVYLMVNEGDGKGRCADNVTKVRAAYVDLDGSPLEPVMAYLPHLVVESSPGKYHAYWLLDDCPLDQFTPIQKALINKFQGDKAVHDLPRVMRVPGFFHHKGEPFQTEVIHQCVDIDFLKTADFLDFLDLNLSFKPATKTKSKITHEGAPEGERNTTLTKIAGFEFSMGRSLEETIDHCLGWNQRNEPPLSDDEVIATVESIHRTHQRNHGDDVPTTFTDTRMAETFAKKYGGQVRWWDEAGKWLIYDGTKWSYSYPGGAFPLLKQMIADISTRVMRSRDSTQLQNAFKGLLGLEGHQRQETILKAASKVPSLVVRSDELDTDLFYLNCLNGSIDLSTGELHPHQASDFITRCINVDYMPRAQCPEFLKFLDRVLAGNEKMTSYLQRFLGYCLTGETTEQVFLFLYGTGANGKTTLANIMEILLGDFATTAGASLLMLRGNRGSTNDLAGLRGTRLVKISEINEDERLDEAMVKTLTGEDKVSCRFLYGEFFTYKPTYKVVMLGNYKPRIKGRDHGIWRRIHLLPFNVTIPEEERDPRLMDKLKEELPGILAWAVEGCLLWQRDGLNPPAEVRNEVKAYRDAEDLFQSWFGECCIAGDNYSTSANELYKSFVTFTSSQDVSPQKFGRMLAEAGFAKGKKKGAIYWKGLFLPDE